MKRLQVLLLLISLSVTGFAQDYKPVADKAAVQAKLAEMAKNTKSIQADIKQTKTFSFMDKPLISTGKFYFEKENKLRWQYTNPIDYVMLINGDKVRIREEGTEKSYNNSANKIFKEIKEVIMGCIDGSILNDKNYKSEILSNDKFYQVKLEPQQSKVKNFMKEIRIFIDNKKMELDHIILVDPSGDETKIELTNRKINTAIDDKIFNDF